MDPLNPIGGTASSAFSFGSAWAWPVVIVAAAFVGYLCYDVWRGHLHNKWFKKRREAARRNQREES